MNINRYRASLTRKLLSFVLLISIFALVLYFVLTGLHQASSASDAEGIRIAEESIRRAVINCYASEGIYPPTLEYIESHYGIHIDEKYFVFYEIFAENIMPEITVVRI